MHHPCDGHQTLVSKPMSYLVISFCTVFMNEELFFVLSSQSPGLALC